MGVSFKISQKGKRFRSKPCIIQSGSTALDVDDSKDGSRVISKNESSLPRKLEVSASASGFSCFSMLLFVMRDFNFCAFVNELKV